MIYSSHRKIGFVFIVSILGALLNQTAFAKNTTCSLDLFSKEKYHSSYNGPCKFFEDKLLSRPEEKVFVVERLNPNLYISGKVVGIQITDFKDFSYINGAFAPNGRDATLTFSDNAKKFTDKNKICWADKAAGFKLCIW
jgi:hypothetical protein